MSFKGVIIVAILPAGMSLFLGTFYWALATQSEQRKFCLTHGYPEAVGYFDGTGYCIKRVDQTDVVVPFSELRK